MQTLKKRSVLKNGSGLAAETDVLLDSVKNTTSEDIQKALSELQARSIIIFRKHLNAWGIYSGSDFDVETAVLKAYSEVESANLSRVSELSDLYPVIAKRLYRDTGTMRWFSRAIVFSGDLDKHIQEFRPQNGCSGEFLLVLPSRDASKYKLDNLIRECALTEYSD